ncbi:MAG: GntR family transcriptional regulator [Bacillota bacterium]|uniref:GntR family transcriptional regulator n=1 Tax=Thermanaerosceptrum fracticalcis TaxID=1712410 RepID=A0A7G6DZC8_THEFR|nr:GntR family transcriptional regulator [Thermanaerosceptrum fracticalcis]QNB45182.1 GntR family transcriptional regulator [Thermanaerosceptrum fracticalcis]
MDTKISKPLPLYQMGYDKIKNFIISGTLSPGQRLTDNQLAELLGISRTPVREAVRMLCREGLLKSDDGIVTVYEPTPKDLGETYSVRAALEGLAISIVIARGVHLKLADQLEEIINISLEEEKNKNYAKVAECNKIIHCSIIEASQNQLISEQMEAINSKMALFRRLSLSHHKNLLISINEHQELVKSLRTGSIIECRRLWEMHIVQAGYRLFLDLLHNDTFNENDYKPIGDYLKVMVKIFDKDVIDIIP